MDDPSENSFVILRWVDNNVVIMVSNIHEPTETVTKERKRPRTTNTNKKHVAAVFGSCGKKEIDIPKVRYSTFFIHFCSSSSNV